MRVVRFYVCGPSFTPPFTPPFLLLPLLAVLFAKCRQMLRGTSRVQWAMPELNREVKMAVGSAGPQPGSSKADWAMPDLNWGAPKRTGQCRTSTGELQSGLGNAGPQPGTFEWIGQWRISAASRYVRRCVRNMSEKNVRKNVRRYVISLLRTGGLGWWFGVLENHYFLQFQKYIF